jgi:hypothetical protein
MTMNGSPSGRARFLQQPAAQELAIEIGANQLQRNRHVDAGVARAKHRAHATFAQQLFERVLAGDHVAGRVAEVQLLRRR